MKQNYIHMPYSLDRNNKFIHLFAGGAAGTFGAIVTCPLEVIKTRLQSSATASLHVESSGVIRCVRSIIKNEGGKALFKGLGPNLVGIAPSRGIYFHTYEAVKSSLNRTFVDYPEHPLTHMTSAACAGFTSCTITNPIWVVKTRLQLSKDSMTVRQCCQNIWRTLGFSGFYKGITASYVGISETIIHFVIYEFIKAQIKSQKPSRNDTSDWYIFLQYLFASSFSKACACTLAYPHEVIRTRLREEGKIYKTFGQTISLIRREEGLLALYRGLNIQLIRAIPHTAITMTSYEFLVSLLIS